MLTFKSFGVLHGHNAAARARAIVREFEKEGFRVVEVHEAVIKYTTFGEEQHIVNQEDITHIVAAQFKFGKAVEPVTSVFTIKAIKKPKARSAKKTVRKPKK